MIGRMILIFISALIYLGCAAKPVKIEFSTAHPVNPLAQESSFFPPPNPFMDQGESALIRQDSQDSMGHQNMQMEQHKGYSMPKEPHQKPMKQSTDEHGHQEHN
jgi:hypothetical protein